MRKPLLRLAVFIATCASASAAFAQEKPAVAARPQTSFEISGTLLNAITGDPLSKAKVWVIPILTDANDDAPAQGTGARFARGGQGFGPGGAGFGPGGGGPGGGGPGGGRNFQGRGQGQR